MTETVISYQPSAISYQLSAVSNQLSVISKQLLAIKQQKSVYSLILLIAVLFLFLPSVARAADDKGALLAGLDQSEIFRLGERMYRDGILPSGEPMKAFVNNDVPVSGSSFTCVSCHLRSGLGSVEGGVVTPSANGRILYTARKPYIPGAELVPLIHNYAAYMPDRPAYTDETLSALISTGFDPAGRAMSKTMPRYAMVDRDMAILIAYLKTLSDKPSPGVTTTGIKFATVVAEGVDPLAVKSMLAPIQFSVDRKNSLSAASKKNDRVARMGYNMLGNLSNMIFSLSQWTLKGPSDTWRQQLEDYYRAEPVFALLGGITNGDWEPVHRFCEENKIPDLMPAVSYPVLSESDWYTLYPSRGIRQEGEAAARYLNGMSDLLKGRQIVQIVRDSRMGHALAAGFRDTWKQAGHSLATELILGGGDILASSAIEALIAKERPAVILLWDDDTALKAIESIQGRAEAPKIIIASGTYLGKSALSLPENIRDLVYMTYPYRLPQEDARYDHQIRKVVPGQRPESFDYRILRQSFIAGDLLGKALMEMRGEYYRDFLLDTIGMMSDMHYPLYERVSFGPGQRYASKGCFIVQLGKGSNPELERRSEWTIQ